MFYLNVVGFKGMKDELILQISDSFILTLWDLKFKKLIKSGLK